MIELQKQPAFRDKFMYGFDSFSGLPEEAEGHGKQSGWSMGNLNSGDVRKSLKEQLGGPAKVAFVKGYFNESLTPTLAGRLGMKPASYIDVDADLYISTKQALAWMFENGLVVPGTVVGYDDWWTNPCSIGGEGISPLDTGEGKAHAEVANEFGVVFRCVAGGCRAQLACQAWGAIFVVENILGKGVSGGDHGFHMTRREITTWKAAEKVCINLSKKWHRHFSRNTSSSHR
jgi:hypothetical protein